MKKHFVTFFSPGTFFAEQTTKEVESWHVANAVEMARAITERYSAKPYAMQFSTIDKTGSDWNVKETETARSPRYFLGGMVLTLADIEARNDPKDSILISNMKSNGWERVVENTNSWKSVQPLLPEDVVLDVDIRNQT